MKKSFLLFATVLMCVGCNKKVDKEAYVVDCDQVQDVLFEDVTTNVRVVPLMSSEPLGASYSVMGSDDEVFIRDNTHEYVYYLKDNKLQGTLHSVGRGPGEYITLKHISYNKNNKVLYLQHYEDSKTILQYSVPDMKYIGKLTVPASSVARVYPYDDNTLIMAMESEPNKPGVFLYDIKSQQITRKVCDIGSFSFSYSERILETFSKDHPYMSQFGTTHQICRIGADSIDVMFKFNFGKYTPDAMVYGHIEDLADAERVLGYFFDSQNSEMVKNFIYPYYTDNENLSFWYTNLMGDKFWFFKMENGKAEMYKGFRIPGLNLEVKPSFSTGHGYAMIIEGVKESLIDPKTPLSPLAQKIIDVMSSQNDNNPVLLYFDIK